MKVQVIKGSKGEDAGVFITMNDWLFIKNNYPDIEESDKDLPEWEKRLIDQRLDSISKNPERVKEGSDLLEELKRKI